MEGDKSTSDWKKRLGTDPVPTILASNSEVIAYFVKRDLLGETVGPIERLWELPEAKRLLERQQPNGAWKYHGGKDFRSHGNYNQLETYRILGQLVEKYGFNRSHPAIRRAANFLFKFQTEEGDFRGIYGNQYTPNYSAAIMELLIKAGYEDGIRIHRGFKWLLSIRQESGGWAIPFRTVQGGLRDILEYPELFKPDRTRPSSYLITGIVLRAFAAHSKYRASETAREAAELLKAGFLKPDHYPDRSDPKHWTKFQYPFWWTNLLTSLDSLSLIGLTAEDRDVKRALQWFVDHQERNGLWKTSYEKAKDRSMRLWVALAVCRMFKRLG